MRTNINKGLFCGKDLNQGWERLFVHEYGSCIVEIRQNVKEKMFNIYLHKGGMFIKSANMSFKKYKIKDNAFNMKKGFNTRDIPFSCFVSDMFNEAKLDEFALPDKEPIYIKE